MDLVADTRVPLYRSCARYVYVIPFSSDFLIECPSGGRRGSASSVRTLKAKPEIECKQAPSIKEEQDPSKHEPTPLLPPADVVQPTA
jgi:hypothetical protein